MWPFIFMWPFITGIESLRKKVNVRKKKSFQTEFY